MEQDRDIYQIELKINGNQTYPLMLIYLGNETSLK